MLDELSTPRVLEQDVLSSERTS